MGVSKIGIALLVSLTCWPAACGGTNHDAQARGAFIAFQDALFARDPAAVRRLLTRESRKVVPHLPWERVIGKQRLEPLRVDCANGRYHVTVRDPNENDREAIWVVVREDSHWRVDLLETTLFNHREVALPGPPMRLVPKQMTAEEIHEIAAREASSIR